MSRLTPIDWIDSMPPPLFWHLCVLSLLIATLIHLPPPLCVAEEEKSSRPVTPSIQSPKPLAPLRYDLVATIGKHDFHLEVVQTQEAFVRGLMYRPQLPERHGMLFPFQLRTPQPYIPQFWMKNCQMALDIIFVKDHHIIALTKAAPPCQNDPCPIYTSGKPTDYVMELQGGTAEAYGFSTGDPVHLSKPLAIHVPPSSSGAGPSPQNPE